MAGTLRLDLAQFRELEAFAQFGSDLDKSTQAQLNRGQRMVELLKQPQYQPMPAEKQVMSLFAGTRGYLDKYPASAVADFEKQLFEFVEGKYPQIFSELKEKEDISDELDATMKKALDEFAAIFQPV